VSDPAPPPSITTPMLRYWRHWGVALSQSELAAKVGVSATTISRLERGGRTHPALVQRLTQFFIDEVEAPGEEDEEFVHSEPGPIDLTQPLSDEQRAWLDEQRATER
jgi:transcriptional regulator with XRE-family HTH domain